jgi:hypothetical protein
MKEINYREYKHSYAHALDGKTDSGKSVMSAIRFAACQKKDSNFVFNLLKKYVFQNPNVIYTEKETQFHDDMKFTCLVECNPVSAYYHCKNALLKAEETIVQVDDNGNLIER